MKHFRIILLLIILGAVLRLGWESDALMQTLDYRKVYTLPRGLRNNNPTNLRPLEGDTWDGQVGIDNGPRGPYCIFPTVLKGMRAGSVNLLTYIFKRGAKTPNLIAQRWSPAKDNNQPSQKAKLIAEALGCGIDADVTPFILEKGPAVMSAIVVDENTVNPIPAALYDEAWRLAREYKHV